MSDLTPSTAPVTSFLSLANTYITNDIDAFLLELLHLLPQPLDDSTQVSQVSPEWERKPIHDPASLIMNDYKSYIHISKKLLHDNNNRDVQYFANPSVTAEQYSGPDCSRGAPVAVSRCCVLTLDAVWPA